MKLLDYINIFRHRVVRNKLFRNEAELSMFSSKTFNLPRVQFCDESTLPEFKNNYPFRFFSNDNELIKIRSELKKIEHSDDIIAQGIKALNNIIPVPGTADLHLGDKIRWNNDVESGYSWDNEIVWRRDFYDVPKGVNLSNVWRIGRLNQGILLGKAYLLTSNENYVKKYISLIEEFEEANPFCRGVNWVSTSETAVRLLNLIYSLSFIIDSTLLNSEKINKILKLILSHSVYLENNSDYNAGRDSGNLISTLALAAAGLVFRKSEYGKKIFDSSFNTFEMEIRIRVNDDGTSSEQSVPYHSVILESLYLAKIIFDKAGRRFSHSYNDLLHKMFIVQEAYLRGDHSVPQIGECIAGRMLYFNLSDLSRDFSFPLSVGAYLFRNEELKKTSCGTAELLFLFGSEAIETFKKVPGSEVQIKSAGFLKGKHFIIRSEDLHLFIEAGEIGIPGGFMRGHSDIFSFDLYYKNMNFIVDPGSSYSANGIYNQMRSIKYHNSVYVDDEHLAESNGRSQIKYDLTKPIIKEWYSDEQQEILTAEHYGYTRLSDPVICRRSFVFSKDKKQIKIKDELLGGAKHQVNMNLFLHPTVKIKQIKENEYIADNNGVKIRIKLISSSGSFKAAEGDALYADFGEIIQGRRISVILKDKFPAFILTEIELL